MSHRWMMRTSTSIRRRTRRVSVWVRNGFSRRARRGGGSRRTALEERRTRGSYPSTRSAVAVPLALLRDPPPLRVLREKQLQMRTRALLPFPQPFSADLRPSAFSARISSRCVHERCCRFLSPSPRTSAPPRFPRESVQEARTGAGPIIQPRAERRATGHPPATPAPPVPRPDPRPTARVSRRGSPRSEFSARDPSSTAHSLPDRCR